MKDKFIRVPHNDILRKAVQEYAFWIGKKWYADKSAIFFTRWDDECILIRGENLTQATYAFCKRQPDLEELNLSEFFSLKPEEKEPDFFEQWGDEVFYRPYATTSSPTFTINELADAIISKAMAKLKE